MCINSTYQTFYHIQPETEKIMNQMQLMNKYQSILHNDESYGNGIPTNIIRGVLQAIKDGKGVEHLRLNRSANEQHMDAEYFRSVRWVWDEAIAAMQ